MADFYNTDGEQGKYILQDLILPALHATPEAIAQYEAGGRKRIHWLDGASMPGSAIQFNSSWYVAANHQQTEDAADDPTLASYSAHVHDVPELLGFYGTDPNDPYNLGGEIEFWIEGEKHLLTKTTLIYLPAGVWHSPLFINRVDNPEHPILHFRMVLNGNYELQTGTGNQVSAL